MENKKIDENNPEDFYKFMKAYRESKDSNRNLITSGSGGYLTYKENGVSKSFRIDFWKLSGLAKKLKDKTIEGIEISPKEKGKAVTSIYNSLKMAFSGYFSEYFQLDASERVGLIKESISGMYLLGLTENKTLLRFMEKQLNETPGLGDILTELGDSFRAFVPVKEDYEDLSFRDNHVLSFIIGKKLRPEGVLSKKEALKKGHDEAFKDAELLVHIWPTEFGAARIIYNKDGHEEVLRLRWLEASKLADKILDKKVKDVYLPVKERGKLEASVERSIKHLLDGGSFSELEYSPFDVYLFTREAIAGLYLLGKSRNKKTKNILSKLTKKYPHLEKDVDEEFSKYLSN